MSFFFIKCNMKFSFPHNPFWFYLFPEFLLTLSKNVCQYYISNAGAKEKDGRSFICKSNLLGKVRVSVFLLTSAAPARMWWLGRRWRRSGRGSRTKGGEQSPEKKKEKSGENDNKFGQAWHVRWTQKRNNNIAEADSQSGFVFTA